jgi:nicotinamide mononucleotide transporter
MQYLKDYFENWNWWDWSWTVIASIVGTWIGLQWGEGGWRTWLSIITMLTGMWCVILVAKGRIFNYYIGIVNILGYGYISFTYQLYGETMLNILYYLPMSFFGLYIWSKHKDLRVKDAVDVRYLSDAHREAYGALTILAFLVYGIILNKMGDPYPYLDSASTVLSIVAMWALAWRYFEQWILWIIVDVVSVYMWYRVMIDSGTNDIALLVMWIAFLINAVYGYISWYRMVRDYSNHYPMKTNVN